MKLLDSYPLYSKLEENLNKIGKRVLIDTWNFHFLKAPIYFLISMFRTKVFKFGQIKKANTGEEEGVMEVIGR